ncbi:MAG: hypothetical protein BWZ01_03160 [Deltaproteobacteria bacterium ADurb.BinA179]|nr:MAG: hypothetical protein BWZ01_03160 [Deltaproteobacteria bacterium ADurb.BinA179]
MSSNELSTGMNSMSDSGIMIFLTGTVSMSMTATSILALGSWIKPSLCPMVMTDSTSSSVSRSAPSCLKWNRESSAREARLKRRARGASTLMRRLMG